MTSTSDDLELVPASLTAYVIGELGQDEGRAWLSAAVPRARAMAAVFGCRLQDAPHPNGSRSLVWLARCPDGRAVVVRVDRPGSVDYDAVRALAAVGASPRILAREPQQHASVIEFVDGTGAEPGKLTHTRAVAETLARLRDIDLTPLGSVEPFPAWVDRFATTAVNRCPGWASYVRRSADALHAAHAATNSADILTHGDLTPGNVIITAAGRAAPIDPEPHAAPIERDAAGFAQRTAIQSGTAAGPHLRALHERLGLDPALAGAMLDFADLTYAAYRRFRDTGRTPVEA